MKEQNRMDQALHGMYDPQFEHDNCGIGAVVNMKGIKSHKTVEDALCIVENLEHRAGKDAEGKTGDGVGIIRFPIHFSGKPVMPAASGWAKSGNTASACFSFPRRS